ncbi:MFS transporter [Liquorilactobacillus mali]|uniref:Cyanate permease n=1 Tax=Liquorilactobacillus mali KCTC 3596 = DSM 20444 TaxID=1046596 RepID=J0L598_9LACO|nr:MFS transporter [Liquorilactobacillus mali]EJE99153.1 cyanate permease [Liquorilactobacillus mali KCTC 3596 = DSM 20444]KRN08891.1 cyanate permease [Liquorilactobacillus mali KCTC 3596 = DSM 20444]MDC7952803.1 MFS transporter [Liquorilactobacillus mali]QFQ75410.1 MFS transporter [Liquorilactobacillus mali]
MKEKKLTFNFSWEVFLIAGNLRLAIIVIPPISHYIMQSLNLSTTEIGTLTSIPLVCFGLLSIFIPLVIQNLGTYKTMILALSLLIIANFFRVYSVIWLFLGTALIGIAITMLNILTPTIIVERAPKHAAFLNGIYTATLNLWAAAIGYSAAPLAKKFGWQNVVQLVSILPIITLIGWLLITNKSTDSEKNSFSKNKSIKIAKIINRPKVWLLAIFMGLQSFIYYGLVAWLPSILVSLKLSVLATGSLFALFQFVGIPLSYIIPRINTKKGASKWILGGLFIGYISGLGLLNLKHPTFFIITIAIITLGLTTAAIFSLALGLITTLSDSAQETSIVSGIVQSIGYLLACISPTLLGKLNSNFDNWNLPLTLLLGLAIITILVGGFFLMKNKITS